jgi:hypothetical protein
MLAINSMEAYSTSLAAARATWSQAEKPRPGESNRSWSLVSRKQLALRIDRPAFTGR